MSCFFFFKAEDGIRDRLVTGVQTCALPICVAIALSLLSSPLPPLLGSGYRDERRESAMATRNVAAVDLGAESGRVILARFDGQQLSLEEVHRFPNRPVTLHRHRFWNMLGLWDEVLAGLRKARLVAGKRE